MEIKLTHSENEIAKLIKEGKTNKEIAHELYLTVGTVEQYVSKILMKMGTKNRTLLALMLRNETKNL